MARKFYKGDEEAADILLKNGFKDITLYKSDEHFNLPFSEFKRTFSPPSITGANIDLDGISIYSYGVFRNVGIVTEDSLKELIFSNKIDKEDFNLFKKEYGAVASSYRTFLKDILTNGPTFSNKISKIKQKYRGIFEGIMF